MNGFIFLSVVLVVGFVIVIAPLATPWLDRTIERLNAKRDEALGKK